MMTLSDFLLQKSWWIPCYGLIGAVLTLPWATGAVSRTGPRPAAYFNVLMTFMAFVHGSIVFQATWNQEPQQLVFNWLQVLDLDLTFTFDISEVNVAAMELVTGLSLLAQFFALGYMEKDWALARFFALMGFFEGAMSGLAISDSLLFTYGLLEILTLSTYLLVGFWYAQPLVVTAARDAFLTKRVGDIFLLMGIVALASIAGDLNFPSLYSWAETANLSPTVATLLGLALIAGPIGKCAQFPLHLWLDEAMEGPNPASILRNSVVVAGGAFVLIKLEPIVALSSVAMTALVVIGAVTAVGASLVAIAQIDIKRALSHSTSAYLGLVFVAVGLQQQEFALMLLFTHAIAKATLFMSVGSIISTTQNQDLTELGGLWSKMPATTLTFLVGAVSLVAIPPLGGFWSFQQGVSDFWTDQPIVVVVILLVNALTSMNLTRIFRLVFLGAPQPKTKRAPEVFWVMAVPMVSLIVVNFLIPVIMSNFLLLPKHINWQAAIALIVSTVTGSIVGGSLYLHKAWSRSRNFYWRALQDTLGYDFYVDRLYQSTVVLVVAQLSKFTNWCDRFLVDGLVNFVGFSSIFSGESLKYSTTGQSQGYLLTILLSVGALSLLMTWSLW
jgi:NAD(P)H-quinone oxidoreductase subunit 5